MKHSLGHLIFWTLALWAVVVYPAQWLWGSEMWAQSGAALLICLLPASASMMLIQRAFVPGSDQQVMAVFGGMGIRMFLVLGIGLVAFMVVPILHEAGFWLWLGVFYLATLALEVGLLVKKNPV